MGNKNSSHRSEPKVDVDKNAFSTHICNRCHEQFSTEIDLQYHRCKKDAVHAATPNSIEDVPEVKVFGGSIHVCTGDITQQKMDAIVVTTTTARYRDSVLQKAGDSIKKLYTDQAQAKPDTSFSTDSGYLPCKKIFFIPSSKLSKTADRWVFRTIVSEAIQLIVKEKTINIRSIVFPAVGCGFHGCDINFVAETLLRAVAYELEQRPNLPLSVYFIVQSRDSIVFNKFAEQLKLLNSRPQSSARRPITPRKPSAKDNAPVFERRVLDPSSDVYKEVVQQFRKTISDQHCKQIVRIENIRNKRWYRQYLAERDDFNHRLKENTERRLFHGCSEKAADGIMKEFFNRGFAGSHGVSYGQGCYFSSNASYSHTYATPNEKGERRMFLARVLVGKTTRGDSSMKLCPPGFDSTTDGSHIFVVYRDSQAFGEYLITYK
ncbi:unnamed protein product [Adineta ricciae]|uniref:Poly [ADP-ribose] polymerase n=1 Tax=Adineta ricciae TaxID=249248 RepID=A0A815LK29_ADIRI|nr:unnamed protein product [Adineta ricciae]